MEKLMILLVEDDPVLVNAISKKLNVVGFKAINVSSAKEALKILDENSHVAAIWLDHYLLGHENGLNLVSILKKKDSKHKSVPVFVVSNTATEDKIKSYLELGVKKFYVKANCRLEDIIEDIKQDLGGNF